MNDIDLIRIIDVEYLGGCTLKLKFSNGEWRVVDFTPLLTGSPRFEELANPDNFIQFGLTHWTIEWYNGVDFAPNYLYEQGKAA